MLANAGASPFPLLLDRDRIVALKYLHATVHMLKVSGQVAAGAC
jgi:hypothetical protein